jgi:hypothetical protein
LIAYNGLLNFGLFGGCHFYAIATLYRFSGSVGRRHVPSGGLGRFDDPCY